MKDMKNYKYYKTINNFNKSKNNKNIFLEYQKNKNKVNNHLKNILISKNNNKKSHSTLMSKTTKNFHFNYIKIINSPHENIKKRNIKEKLGLNRVNNNNMNNNKQIKLPKYDKYKKYLFQLYRPDYKFNDFIKNEQSKKINIKRTYSQ